MIRYKGGNWQGKRNITEQTYWRDYAGRSPLHYLLKCTGITCLAFIDV